MSDDIQVYIPQDSFSKVDPTFPPLNDEIINEIESRFGLVLHELEPLPSGEYAMYELGIGCELYITTYFNHAIVRLGYGKNQALTYAHCENHNEPGKIIEAVLSCMKQLYNANILRQQRLLTYIEQEQS